MNTKVCLTYLWIFKFFKILTFAFFLTSQSQAQGTLAPSVIRGLKTPWGQRLLSQIISQPVSQIAQISISDREQLLIEALKGVNDFDLRASVFKSFVDSGKGFDESALGILAQSRFIEAFGKIEVPPPELLGVARLPEKGKEFPD